MSKNIDQVFTANPITSNVSTDLMYFGQSPYGAGNDAAMTYSNFSAQLANKGANSNITSMTGLTGKLEAPTAIADSSGNNNLAFTYTASAVNYLTSANSATTHAPALLAQGSDSNIPLALGAKSSVVQVYDPLGVVSGKIRYYNAANTQYTGLTVATTQSTSVDFSLPAADGSSGYPIITNGSGVLSLSPTTTITGLGTQAQALNMGSNAINNVSDPVNAQDAATKNYVNTIAAGLNPVEGCAAATTANLNATYSNGVAGVGATLTNAGAQAAFAVDGYSASVGDRILVKNQTSTFQNGIYNVTTLGSGSSNWVLTRATDYNTPSQISVGDLLAVENGTTNALSAWYQTATVVTIGTSAIIFSVFFNPASYISSTLSNGTILIGNVSNVATQSTSTWPSTTTINQILYSSSANTVAGLSTANNSILQTNGSGVPSFATSLPSGTVFISTVDQTSASVTLAVNTQYITDNGASLVTYTLPTTCAIGSIFKIRGFSSGGWKVAQSSGQQIHVGSSASTSGATGSIASSNQYDCVDLTCVAANNTFVANAVQGALTIV